MHSFTYFADKGASLPHRAGESPRFWHLSVFSGVSSGCPSLGMRGTSAHLVAPEVHALWGHGDMDILHNRHAINVLSIHQLQDRQRPVHNRATKKSALTPRN